MMPSGTIDSVASGTVVQLTDVSARRADPRTTDSQKYLKEEEPKILDWVEQEAARRKRREELDRWAAASATLQLFQKTQRLGTNIPGFDRVFEILSRFIDFELGEGLGRKKRQGFVGRDLWQP